MLAHACENSLFQYELNSFPIGGNLECALCIFNFIHIAPAISLECALYVFDSIQIAFTMSLRGV